MLKLLSPSIIKKICSVNRTWLVTGVAGFIGSNLLELLLLTNQRVIGLDNFSTGNIKNIEDVRNKVGKKFLNFELVEGHLEDFNIVSNVCSNVDIVLHQAALGSVPRSLDNPIATNNANVSGFLNVITAAKNASVKKFVYASSSSVYGDCSDVLKVETSKGKPLSPYALTKVINEEYAEIFSRAYGFNSIGLRYFNVFGPRQNPIGAYAAVIPSWINKIINNENCIIYGDGENSRDFTFISNVVKANILAALSDSALQGNLVFNIATGNRITLNDLHLKLANFFHNDFGYSEVAYPLYLSKRKGDIESSLANIKHAKKILGYKPNVQFDEALKLTIKWFLEKNKCQN